MHPKVFSGCLTAGLVLLSAGASWRYSLADGLMIFGSGLIVLTIATVFIAGRRAEPPPDARQE